MIKEVEIEVVSLAEASEMSVDGRIIDYELTDNGYKCRFLSEVPSFKPTTKVEKNEEFVICAECNGSTLYVAKCNGVTYNFNSAKRFNKTAASQKAYFMKKRGAFDWTTLRVK